MNRMFNTDPRPQNTKHSEPAVFVQVRDIGGGIPGIVLFCNRCPDCRAELQRALKEGGRIIPRKAKPQ